MSKNYIILDKAFATTKYMNACDPTHKAIQFTTTTSINGKFLTHLVFSDFFCKFDFATNFCAWKKKKAFVNLVHLLILPFF